MDDDESRDRQRVISNNDLQRPHARDRTTQPPAMGIHPNQNILRSTTSTESQQEADRGILQLNTAAMSRKGNEIVRLYGKHALTTWPRYLVAPACSIEALAHAHLAIEVRPGLEADDLDTPADKRARTSAPSSGGRARKSSVRAPRRHHPYASTLPRQVSCDEQQREHQRDADSGNHGNGEPDCVRVWRRWRWQGGLRARR